MPTLNWIGKDKVVNHHLDVPFYTLEHQYGFRGDNPDDESETHSGNMIIHGDNLIVLKALLPEFEGRVDCVYIDPPYNTGNEEWVYNDNVNDPRINKWLAEQLGVDPSTVSKWCTNTSQPDLACILKIADLLEVDLKELFVREYKRLR